MRRLRLACGSYQRFDLGVLRAYYYSTSLYFRCFAGASVGVDAGDGGGNLVGVRK